MTINQIANEKTNQTLQEQADYGRLDMDIDLIGKTLRYGKEYSGNYKYSEIEILTEIKQIMIAKAWYLYYRIGTR